MPRARLIALLSAAEERIELAQGSIDAQRCVIEDMRLKGYATGDAETHLTFLLAHLAVHEAERERLLATLAALPPPQDSS